MQQLIINYSTWWSFQLNPQSSTSVWSSKIICLGVHNHKESKRDYKWHFSIQSLQHIHSTLLFSRCKLEAKAIHVGSFFPIFLHEAATGGWINRLSHFIYYRFHPISTAMHWNFRNGGDKNVLRRCEIDCTLCCFCGRSNLSLIEFCINKLIGDIARSVVKISAKMYVAGSISIHSNKIESRIAKHESETNIWNGAGEVHYRHNFIGNYLVCEWIFLPWIFYVHISNYIIGSSRQSEKLS